MEISFLRDYATILIFLVISVSLGFGFIVINFLFSPRAKMAYLSLNNLSV